MPIFEDFCNSEANQPKILKFEGNTPIILQGGSYIFSSNELSLRHWFKTVTSWTTQTSTILPSDTATNIFNFNTLFILVTPPNIIGINPIPILDIKIQLYEMGSLTPDVIIPIGDTLFMTFPKEYEKIEILNNSTGLTLPHNYSILLTK